MKGDYRDLVLPPGTKVLQVPAEMGGPAPAVPSVESKKMHMRGNKYGAKPTEYNGVRYASKAEAQRARVLDQEQADGFINWWIGQPKFRLGCPENIYVGDFLVVSPEGTRVEDVKGVETSKFKRDRKLWARYGPCDLWLIKGKKIEVIRPE